MYILQYTCIYYYNLNSRTNSMASGLHFLEIITRSSILRLKIYVTQKMALKYILILFITN